MTVGRPPLASAVVLIAGLVALGAAGVRAAGARSERVEPPEADRRGAEAAVQLFLKLAAHVQGSSGDPRFAERLPAAPPVIEELVAGVAFATHADRIEEPRLVRSEILRSASTDGDRIQVDAKEYWIIRVIASDGRVLETRSDVVRARYLVGREAAGWQILGWDPLELAKEQEGRR